MLRRVGSTVAIAALGLFSLPASAALQWQFANSTGTAAIAPVSSPASVAHCGQAASSTYGNCETWHSTPGTGPDVNVNAWSNTVGSNPATATNTIQDAYLGMYSSGLGVSNRNLNTTGTTTGGGAEGTSASSPNHTIDNYRNTDAVLLSFKSSVNLTGVVIGFPEGTGCTSPGTGAACDTDISIWAYTGGGALNTATNLATRTYANLTSAGWTIVGTYTNLVADTTKLVNGAASVDSTGGISSQYWLISAAYPNQDGNYDFVKLESVYGTTGKKVPEPGGLALLLAAMIGGTWLRRAKN